MWQLIWWLANSDILMQNKATTFFLFLSDNLYVKYFLFYIYETQEMSQTIPSKLISKINQKLALIQSGLIFLLACVCVMCKNKCVDISFFSQWKM